MKKKIKKNSEGDLKISQEEFKNYAKLLGTLSKRLDPKVYHKKKTSS